MFQRKYDKLGLLAEPPLTPIPLHTSSLFCIFRNWSIKIPLKFEEKKLHSFQQYNRDNDELIPINTILQSDSYWLIQSFSSILGLEFKLWIPMNIWKHTFKIPRPHWKSTPPPANSFNSSLCMELKLSLNHYESPCRIVSIWMNSSFSRLFCWKSFSLQLM